MLVDWALKHGAFSFLKSSVIESSAFFGEVRTRNVNISSILWSILKVQYYGQYYGQVHSAYLITLKRFGIYLMKTPYQEYYVGRVHTLFTSLLTQLPLRVGEMHADVERQQETKRWVIPPIIIRTHFKLVLVLVTSPPNPVLE